MGHKCRVCGKIEPCGLGPKCPWPGEDTTCDDCMEKARRTPTVPIEQLTSQEDVI